MTLLAHEELQSAAILTSGQQVWGPISRADHLKLFLLLLSERRCNSTSTCGKKYIFISSMFWGTHLSS